MKFVVRVAVQMDGVLLIIWFSQRKENSGIKQRFSHCLRCCKIDFNIENGRVILKDDNTIKLFLFMVDNKNTIADMLDEADEVRRTNKH